MTSIIDFLKNLRKQQIVVYVEENALKIKGAKELLSDAIIGAIKERKQEILTYFEQHANNTPVPVSRAEDKDYYPLSYAQRRIYYLQSVSKDSVLYNINYSVKMNGRVDTNKLQEIFRQLIGRHESLRTSFVWVDHAVMQRIEDEVRFSMDLITCTEISLKDNLEQYSQPFRMEHAPLMRAGLFSMPGDRHLLRVVLHHSIADGYSNMILLREFMKLYQGETPEPLSMRYRDFTEWQHSPAMQERINTQKAFWLNEFNDLPPLVDLPADFKRPDIKPEKGGNYFFTLEVDRVTQLKAIALQNGSTLFTVLLSMYAVMIRKLSSNRDIVIGIPASGRHHPEWEEIIGMFVNTIPLRLLPEGELPFNSFCTSVQQKLLLVLENQDYPYDNLVKDIKLSHLPGRNPLFDHMFLLENSDTTSLSLPGLTMEGYVPVEELSKFDLTLIGKESGEQLEMRFEYSTGLFTADTICRFAGYFMQIVSEVCADPSVTLSSLNMIGHAEREKLLYQFNDTAFTFPEEKPVIRLFESIALLQPELPAVCDEKQELTYGELNKRANQLAVSIMERLQPGSNGKIAFLTEPSADMVAVMLAILKTGNAYVPLSAEMPVERNLFIFRDSGASLLVIQQQLLDLYPGFRELANVGQLLVINVLQPGMNEVFSSVQAKNELMYLIYTSGTTGTPKGVEVRSKGVLNMVHYYRHAFGLKEGDRVSQVASISFDASAFEIWPALSFGATLLIAPSQVRRSPQAMLQWLIQQQIGFTFQTPHVAALLLQDQRLITEGHLKICNVAGDVFTYYPKIKLPFKLYNLYGPTEDSVWTTWQELRFDIPNLYYSIGRPIGNKQIYIIDTYRQLVPVGVAGELCIGGTGLAKGYMNNASLTEEKFVELPSQPGKAIYRTGDLARWKEDGSVEYLGRIDEQVKLRGYRIELREIEQVLNLYPGIQESVVAVAENNGNPQLVAYYTAAAACSSRELKIYLRDKLPAYMIPVFFMRVDYFPINTSGKVDRKKLPAPLSEPDEPIIAPSSQTENKLVEIWAGVLSLPSEKIGVTMNFFELGGNSMNIIQLNNRVNEEFDCALTVTDMFMLATIQDMQEYITTKGKKDITLTAKQLDESVNEADENIRLMQNF